MIHSRSLRRAIALTVFLTPTVLFGTPGWSDTGGPLEDEGFEVTDYLDDCDGCRGRGALLRWPGADAPVRARPDRIITDEPHIADSAAVVGLGTIQLEQNNVFTRDDAGGSITEGFTPALLLRIGMICDWFELRLAWAYNDEYTFDSTAGGVGVNRDGADDLQVASKIAVAQQHGLFPEFAIFPQITVPTGAERFSSDEVMPGIVFSYGWEMTEKLGLEVNTSFDRARDDAGDFYTQVLHVMNLEFEVVENFVLFNEFIGVWPSDATVARTEYTYHGGFMYFPNNDFVLFVHAATGLNEAADNFFAGIGFSVRTK